jgi:hypothetical protein
MAEAADRETPTSALGFGSRGYSATSLAGSVVH